MVIFAPATTEPERNSGVKPKKKKISFFGTREVLSLEVLILALPELVA